MACDTEVLKRVPLFALLDADEIAVLAAQVEIRHFAANQRIYKRGEPGARAYIVIEGRVRITTIDEDHQELTIDEPAAGEFFGFASLLDGTPHETNAITLEPSTCVEIDRPDLETLIRAKPDAGMDMLAVLGRHFHAAQHLARTRSLRNPNEVIEESATVGERISDAVAQFGGSWRFIISFGLVLIVYTALNVGLGRGAWDPYPFILLNLFLSMLAAIQAPVIMMSQNRQDAKDRLRGELDFEVNRRAELEVRGLARRLAELRDKVDDVEDLLRAGAPGRQS